MRAGWFVSAVGHVGAAMMTILTAWEASPIDIPTQGVVVPVEIVAISSESNVRALAPEQPEEETPPPEPAEEAAPEPAEDAPSTVRRETPRRNEMDLAALQRSLLVDKQREARPERTPGAPSERLQRGAGLGADEVVRLEDRMRALTRAHMRRCWREPADLPEPERLVVTVQFDLDRNGNVRGAPRVTNPSNYAFDAPMRTAVEAALRAVRVCEPYPFPEDPVVSDHYDMWRNMEYTFRPQAGG